MYPHVDADVTDVLDGTYVVPVSVRLNNVAYSERLRDGNKAFVLIRGVDEHADSGATTSNHEDVVVEGSDDESVNFDGRIGPNNLYPLHTLQHGTEKMAPG